MLRDRFDPVVATWFLVGFFATCCSIRHLVGRTPAVRRLRARPADKPLATANKQVVLSRHLLRLAFPLMPLLFNDHPLVSAVAYGAFGAVFVLFLAGTLLRIPLAGTAAQSWGRCVDELPGLLGRSGRHARRDTPVGRT